MQAAAAHLLLLQRGARPVLRFPEGFSTTSVVCRTLYSEQFLQPSWRTRWTQIAEAEAATAAAAAAAAAVKTTVGTPRSSIYAQVWQRRELQQQQGQRLLPRFTTSFHTCNGRLLISNSPSRSKRTVAEQSVYAFTLPCSDAHEGLRQQNIWLLQQQQAQELQQRHQQVKVALQRELLLHQQQQYGMRQLLHKVTEHSLLSAAELPANVLNAVLSLLLRQLHTAAAAAGQHPAASALLQLFSRDLFALSSRGTQGESHEDSSTSSGSSGQPDGNANAGDRNSKGEDSGKSSSNKGINSTSSTGNDGGGNSTRGPRGPGKSAAPGNSTRRVPLGFEAFYPKDALKRREGSSSSNNNGSGRLPFVPLTGGALQHLLLRMCIWLGIWVFALSLLSRVVEPQLSLQVGSENASPT